MSEKKVSDDIKNEFIRHEAKLLEQEHRPLKIFLNFRSRKKKWKNKSDPRRKASGRAVLWFFLSPPVLVVGSVGVMSLYFMYKQTDLLDNQNKLFEVQNERIIQQTHLAEASRRSSQMFIMGEVLSDINTELEDKGNTKRILSNTLVGRIISLSKAMKPYRYLENDSLIENPLSPERGQLLLSLYESEMDSTFFIDRIVKKSDFSYAELSTSILGKISLDSINLSHVNLEKAILIRANMNNANLSGANLTRAYMVKASLIGANLSNTNLQNANFKDADLKGVNLRGAQLTDTYFYNANLNLKLSGVNMKGADLSGAKIDNLNLSGVLSLDSTLIDRSDWLSYIKDELNLSGSKVIYNQYRIDSLSHPVYGTSYMLVKKNR
ncbi:MAG: pentapeptide repeat-containing protein [Flavobacteriaceae bacterium]